MRIGCRKFLVFQFLIGVLAFILVLPAFSVNTDGVLLLSFRYSITDDPLFLLENWFDGDQTPCAWYGVTCDASSHVTSLSLPNSRLLGSIPSDLGLLQTLQRLDLSNNSINGSLPSGFFNLTSLRVLDLSNNLISGDLPENISRLSSLQSLNLSDNDFTGVFPASLGYIGNLTTVSLKNNYFSGQISGRFNAVEQFDLSANLINGSLPSDFGGGRLGYFNVSYNRISDEIPPGFADEIPGNATVDLSFNNLTGQIPGFQVFKNQAFKIFKGNPNLCGPDPRKDPCPVRSSRTPPSNILSPTSPPAIAAIPKIIGSNAVMDHPNDTKTGSNSKPGMKPVVIIGIIIGDLAGIAILGIVTFYVYQFKKKKNVENQRKVDANGVNDFWSTSSSMSESRVFSKWSCLTKNGNSNGEENTETSGSDSEDDNRVGSNRRQGEGEHDRRGTLVTVDPDMDLELEPLLKASAYILGATGSSIMYKAVLLDGSVLAVRRIGEAGVDRFKDFDSQVRIISKLVHPNLVRIKGFYWGLDEKLVIYEFVPNGSLANARYRKMGTSTSPCHLPWDTRLRIAKGVARALSYIHEKKHVHGNLKPSNILLGFDMEPKIGDFGLEKLITGDTSYRTGGSARIFGSKRSTTSHDFGSFAGPTPSPSPSSVGYGSPYQAPESLRSLKPNQKWDVYAFGTILLELLTGKVIAVDESGQWNGIAVDDKDRAIRMVDASIRGELEGKEDILLACFKTGFDCASPVPHKRPNIKEVVQVLDKFPVPISVSTYHYGH